MELLTPREREVCNLIALGHTYGEVARLLQVSVKTVQMRRKSILAKLRLRTRAELVRATLQETLPRAGLEGSFCACCSGCGTLWPERDRFLADDEVRFLRYQPAPAANAFGALLFRHDPCGANLRISLESFKHLTADPLLALSCMATGTREDYCLGRKARQPCPLMCVCTSAHLISRHVQGWPKSNGCASSRFGRRRRFQPGSECC
jgi:DNA-binding CsgD family transcriptional regulator